MSSALIVHRRPGAVGDVVHMSSVRTLCHGVDDGEVKDSVRRQSHGFPLMSHAEVGWYSTITIQVFYIPTSGFQKPANYPHPPPKVTRLFRVCGHTEAFEHAATGESLVCVCVCVKAVNPLTADRGRGVDDGRAPVPVPLVAALDLAWALSREGG